MDQQAPGRRLPPPAGAADEMGGDGTVSEYLGQDRQGRHDHAPAVLLTSRGAVVVMLAVFILGLLMSSWLNLAALSGFAYLAGSALAARYTKSAHLLTVAVSPPLLFGFALAGVKVATASGNTVLSAGAGALLALAGAAPWLFAGTALAIIIAWFRGLPGCVWELRQSARADLWRQGAGSAARPSATRQR